LRAAAQVGLRLVDIARVESREDHVAIGIRQDASAVDIFLRSRVDAERGAMCRHLVEHLLALHVLGGADRLKLGSGPEVGNVEGHHRPKHEMRHIGPLLGMSAAKNPGASASSTLASSAPMRTVIAAAEFSAAVMAITGRKGWQPDAAHAVREASPTDVCLGSLADARAQIGESVSP